ITVDGDTSTNDSLFLLANGQAGNPVLGMGDEGVAAFQAGLNHVCRHLAIEVARDGEGATKLIEVNVTGARTLHDARVCARAIAGSMLLKSAVYGGDPNWGRIMMAAGKSGCDLVESKVDVLVGDVELFRQGTPLAYDVKAAETVLSNKEVPITVRLNLGDHAATAWGCDLTEEYVHINADYTT
ncbi:MAG TPA: bifunctional ornithine acetyltransferase/N-acetylglutamate synthase, partial [Dehalococcoidia bacterium]|nr:bifunctional ornithine acetyltransferase/N-acetylglutamate synthase [Dehalococcoidia bacterium]